MVVWDSVSQNEAVVSLLLTELRAECLGIVSPDVELCRPSFDGLTFWLDVNAIVSEPLLIGSIFAVEWSWHEIRLSTVLFRIDRIQLVTLSIMFCLYRAIVLNGPTLGYRLTDNFKEQTTLRRILQNRRIWNQIHKIRPQLSNPKFFLTTIFLR